MSSGVRRFHSWSLEGRGMPRSRQISTMTSSTARPSRSRSSMGSSRRSRNSAVTASASQWPRLAWITSSTPRMSWARGVRAGLGRGAGLAAMWRARAMVRRMQRAMRSRAMAASGSAASGVLAAVAVAATRVARAAAGRRGCGGPGGNGPRPPGGGPPRRYPGSRARFAWADRTTNRAGCQVLFPRCRERMLGRGWDGGFQAAHGGDWGVRCWLRGGAAA